MADLGTMIGEFFSTLSKNPAYLFLAIGGVVLVLVLAIMHHIHKIHSQEIFVHQAWGANWKGR